MKTSDFDYNLPEELIAQTPVEPRDHSRLLVYDRADRSIQHLHFYDLPRFLNAGDVMVINDTRVIPARLLGEKEETHVPVEILLLKRLEKDLWEALVRPGRRLAPGTWCSFGDGLLRAEIVDRAPEGAQGWCVFIIRVFLRKFWTGWDRCLCRPTFTSACRIGNGIRRSMRGKRAAPPPPPPDCILPRNCWKRSVRRALTLCRCCCTWAWAPSAR